MHTAPTLPLLAALALVAQARIAAQQSTIEGKLTCASTDAPLRVFTIPLRERAGGAVASPSKQEIFAAAARETKTSAAADGSFTVAVGEGSHAVFAFADLDGDGRWDPGAPEPFGWFATEPAGRAAPLRAGARDVAFELRAPQPFPRARRPTWGGTLSFVHDYPVLHLRGDAAQRGYAHGFLIARQIVDFFRYYVLEEQHASARGYLTGFAPFLESHFVTPPAYAAECDALIEGMRASGEDLTIQELGRPFSRTDLLAINAYLETRAMRSSCTQFAAWGERTKGTDVDGGTLTGRNMDGECDVRKVTVSHFLLFAVEPSEPGQKRYVSMMWPGFIGTLSALNEDGFYAMEDAGATQPGPVVDKLVPIAWTMREALARLGADATPQKVQAVLDEFDNSAGGSCGPGCIILFATPYSGQTVPAFVCEGDRYGETMRLPSAVRPWLGDAIACSNHFLQYGADQDKPGVSFGREPSLSTAWRYEAGMHTLEAWSRVDRRIGTAEMRELLQRVAHGTTEHAIITRPNTRAFEVSVASLESELWDAPYRAWTVFAFEEVFGGAAASAR